jgi:flagellar biosynthesis protein FlhG
MTASNVRSIAVTSGKGGVGKSCIALNLAIALGRLEQRVLLVDADLGLGNIAILAGLSPERTIEEVLAGQCGVAEAAVQGPENIVVLPAAAAVDAVQWENFQAGGNIGEQLKEFETEFDVVVLDTGAGIGARVVDFVAAVDHVFLVVTPEPTAIADAYAALKVLVQRRSPQGLGLLVNMAESAVEAEDLYPKFQELAERFLGAKIDNLGYIPLDRYVRESVKRQTPFVLADPPLPAAEAVVRLAATFLTGGKANPPQGAGVLARVLEQQSSSLFLDRIQ